MKVKAVNLLKVKVARRAMNINEPSFFHEGEGHSLLLFPFASPSFKTIWFSLIFKLPDYLGS